MDMLPYFLGRLAEGGTGGSGSGTEYTSIVYNTDNTVTLTDTNGIVYTMSCTYEDGKLIGVTYDGKAVELTYNGDVLVKVGKTVIDVANAPAISGATLNIAYGETAPEDTSKLWIKAAESTSIEFGYNSGNNVENIQTVLSQLPTEIYGISSAAVGNKVYLFGGCSTEPLNSIYTFNTETNEITTLQTTLPEAVYGVGIAVVDTKIYLFGGEKLSGVTNTINVFDTETNEITTLSKTIPVGASYITAKSVGSKIYLFGGVASGALNTINVFDTETNNITTLSVTLQKDAWGMSSSIVGTKIYLFGGRSSSVSFDTIYAFDTKTNAITLIETKLPNAFAYIASESVGSKVYLFGGYNKNNNSYNSDIYAFDTETNAITLIETKLPNASAYIASARIGTKIYLFGGKYSGGRLKTINKFTVTFPLQNGYIFVQEDFHNNRFDIISSPTKVSIGVENVYIGNENNEAELCEAYLHNGTEWVVI